MVNLESMTLQELITLAGQKGMYDKALVDAYHILEDVPMDAVTQAKFMKKFRVLLNKRRQSKEASIFLGNIFGKGFAGEAELGKVQHLINNSQERLAGYKEQAIKSFAALEEIN